MEVQCPICYENYDQETHLPKILPLCGHTVCYFCLKKILQDRFPRCPLDKTQIGKEIEAQNFPKNFALTELLERKVDESMCPKHQKNLSFACFTDQTKLCSDCVEEGQHKKHKIKALVDLQLKVLPQKKELKDLLACCEGNYENVNNMLEEGRTQSLDSIRSNFEEIRDQLYRKELELAFKANSFYDSQLNRFTKRDEADLTLEEDMRMKLKTLVNFTREIDPFKSEEFFDTNKKFIKECKSNMKTNEVNREVGLIRKDLGKNLQAFSQVVQTQVQPLLQLELPFSDDLGRLTELLPLKKIEESPDHDPNILRVSTSLWIRHDEDELKIVAEHFDVMELSINSSGLEMISTVFLWIKRELTARELEILNYIRTFLKGISSFTLKLESAIKSPDLFQIFSPCLDNCSYLEFDLEGYTEQNHSILPLVSKMLRKRKVEEVFLDLTKTKLAWNSLDKNIFKEMFDQTMIENLTLKANSTNIPEAYISALAIPTSLKKLTLDFNWANISNKAVGTMIRTALSSLQGLEDINLQFYNTNLTDEELNNLTISSKVLKEVFIDIGGSAITNKAVKFLFKTLTSCANTLETLAVAFGVTKITDESLDCVSIPVMPKLRSLACNLGGTALTDKAVQLLLDKLVIPSSNLEYLKLRLRDAKFTDVSLRNVSEALERLKKLNSLELNFQRTLITDRGVIPLIREVLPRKKNLEYLKIYIANTAVSDAIGDEIDQFVKDRSQQN